MSSNDTTDAGSVPEETTLSSTNTVVKPELHPLLGEDGDEWEGFYEDEGDWEEL